MDYLVYIKNDYRNFAGSGWWMYDDDTIWMAGTTRECIDCYY